ncbi:hypothetical protein [Pseudomonas sp. CAM1A]|uniref:hypothetical protein n=1 Tax=Pseudomonas sp. CAM1A TaxID=3231717 RepID=UPI0039C73684
MSWIFLMLIALVVGLFVDWACRSTRVRIFLYVGCMSAGMTSCTQLANRQFLLLDGIEWMILFVSVGTPLLFKRSSYFERDRD